MVRRGTRGGGRGAFPAAWMCMMVVVMLAAAAAERPIVLYPSSQACTKPDTTTKTLTCLATDDSKAYSLDSFDWTKFSIEKVVIDNTNSTLEIKTPVCPDATREVVVSDSEKVTTVLGAGKCVQRLVLQDSRNVRIDKGVDSVRMVNSAGDIVSLPRVRQFDLQSSTLREASVEVYEEKSTIVDSTIGVVKKLVINGSFVFEVRNSTLGAVKGFVYENPKDAVFTNVELSVAEDGFLVHDGTVTIKNSVIHSIATHGMSVATKAKLVIEDTTLGKVVHNSIDAFAGGSVTFKNVQVGDARNVSFVLKDANLPVYPLALLEEYATQPQVLYVVLFSFVSLALGFLSGATIMYYMQRRQAKCKTDADTARLIGQEQQSAPAPKSCTAPPPPTRPLPNVPTGPVLTPPQEEEYQEYTDVVTTGAPGAMAWRPPVPVPGEGSSPGGSTLPLRDHANPTTRLNNWTPKKAEKKDSRDILQPPPPPPPPDEELYDDLEGVPPPPDDEELYDELAGAPDNFNPLPPPATNKPKLPPNTNKPKLPPNTSKPKGFPMMKLRGQFPR